MNPAHEDRFGPRRRHLDSLSGCTLTGCCECLDQRLAPAGLTIEDPEAREQRCAFRSRLELPEGR